ncbi:sulfatase-like hydrolase/transferase [Thermococcus sp.]
MVFDMFRKSLPNVILIVLDTLRADYSKPLDDMLGDFGFVNYDSAIAPSSWTLPSHASMFTGVYPALHGAHETKIEKGFGIRLNYPFQLTRELSSHGYRTYLLTANPYIRPSFGFMGFDYFYDVTGWSFQLSMLSHDDLLTIQELKKKHDIRSNAFTLASVLLREKPGLLLKLGVNKFLRVFDPLYQRVERRRKNWPLDKGVTELSGKFLDVLRREKPSNFFAFFNFLEVHEPYYPGDNAEGVRQSILTGEADEGYMRKWRQLYPREVEYLSSKLEEFLNALKDLDVLENSLVIITSDHGQLLGERGLLGHGYYLYDEVLRVPLFVKYPENLEVRLSGSASGHISLVILKSFILSILRSPDSLFDDSVLFSNTVFSESYGIGGITVAPKTPEEIRNVENLEKHRIAVYHGPYKGIYNVDDRTLECVKSYDGSEITEDVKDMLIRDAKKFLKQARLKTAVRRINLKRKP